MNCEKSSEVYEAEQSKNEKRDTVQFKIVKKLILTG